MAWLDKLRNVFWNAIFSLKSAINLENIYYHIFSNFSSGPPRNCINHYRFLFSFSGHFRMSVFHQLSSAILFGRSQSVRTCVKKYCVPTTIGFCSRLFIKISVWRIEVQIEQFCTAFFLVSIYDDFNIKLLS